MIFPTPAFNCLQLGDRLCQFGFGRGVVHIACAVLECFFRMTLGLDGLGFVQIVGADCSIGEQGNQRRLHFEYATGNVN